jgi:acetylornithine/LysW-gamma-L-lysine aminotransferase
MVHAPVEDACAGILRHVQSHQNDPLSGRAASTVIAILREEELVQQADRMGGYLLTGLQKLQASHPAIREVRGLGLMIGVELKQKVTPYLAALMERGVLALPAGLNVLRLLPPLVIEKSDLDIVADQIEYVLSHAKASD